MISKTDFLAEIIRRISHQVDELKEELQGLDSEIANETKSSAGDKFETSREMMNQSRQNISGRIDTLKEQAHFLSQNQVRSTLTKVESGSLVETNEGYFFFGLALGNLKYKDHQVIALSFQSPLGEAFHHKKVGEKVIFRDKSFIILNCS